MIRSTVKAIIIREGKILLNRCHNEKFGDYFSLPGGGQNQCETLEETVIRECLEETGYTVTPVKFAALCESIFTDENARKNDPNYTHRINNVFICEITDNERAIPTNKDGTQVNDEASEWIDINSINSVNKTRLFPIMVADNIQEILNGTAPIYLGSDFID